MKRVLCLILIFSCCGCGSLLRSRSSSSVMDDDDGPESYYDHHRKTASLHMGKGSHLKKKVLVLDFFNATPISDFDVGEMAAAELRNELGSTGRVVLPPESSVPLKTEDYIQGDRVKVAKLVQEARKQGVSLAVLGRISKITLRQKGDEVGLLRKRYSYADSDLEIKLFDVQTGRELAALAKSGEANDSGLALFGGSGIEDPTYRMELTEEALRQASMRFVGEILKSVDKTEWQGRVAKIQGNKIFINAGKASGLLRGDILRVMTSGDDVYDPETGSYLGRSQGLVKGTVEVTEYFGTDGGIGQLHSGGNFQEGDLVQLY